MLPLNQIICGDCIDVMNAFPEQSIDMVMFSPPYWGLRDYGKATEIIWDGTPDCHHQWFEGESQRKKDDIHQNTCVKCGAWRGQLGLEPHPQMYIDHLVQVFRAINKVLRKKGSVYVVLGDTFGGSRCGYGDYRKKPSLNQPKRYNTVKKPQSRIHRGGWVRPKQKLLMPHRVAIALQEDGWIVRNDIVWHKPNAMPSSVKDRLNTTHEYIFHLVKQRKYYYNLDAIREPHKTSEAMREHVNEDPIKKARRFRRRDSLFQVEPADRPGRSSKDKIGSYEKRHLTKHDLAVKRIGKFAYTDPLHTKGYSAKGKNPGDIFQTKKEPYIENNPHRMRLKREEYLALDPSKPMDLSHPKGKNPGDFWNINTKPFPGAHCAVYPEEICIKPILSSCPNEGVVLDPMCGSGTTLVVAAKLGRHYIGIDLNPDYVKIAEKRLRKAHLTPN